jgi:hypothetical protein
MTLRDQILADLDAVVFNLGEFAETITYNGVAISAVVDRRGGPSKASAGVFFDAFIRVKKSDVAAPAYRVPVIIDGKTWFTGKPEDAEGGEYTWRIPVVSSARPVMK